MHWHRHWHKHQHRHRHWRRHRHRHWHRGCRYGHEHDHSGAHMRPFRRYVHARLHRRLFLWFGVSIAMTAAVVAAVVWLGTGGQQPWSRYLDRVDHFVADRYAQVWERPDERAALTRSLADSMRGARLYSADGQLLVQEGEKCAKDVHTIAIVASGESATPAQLGTVQICARFHRRGGPGFALLVLFVGAATLWLATGVIARRLVRPLGVMARVARDIGDGRLDSRVPTGARGTGELATLACAINDMAEHIARQLAEQRELLAAVSHELRTPLGHMRVILEMLGDTGAADDDTDDSTDNGADESGANALVAEMEREVVEMDALVGQLLASSRLSFDAVDERPLDAVELATHALERMDADPALLTVVARPVTRSTARSAARSVDERDTDPVDSADVEANVDIVGDPTLLARALANLLANAVRHGQGIASVQVVREWTDQSPSSRASREDSPGFVRFIVEDRGPGFADDEIERVFEQFYRGEHRAGSSSLGLGLSLVRRIAEAHGGSAWAENVPGGGARVGFSVALHDADMMTDTR